MPKVAFCKLAKIMVVIYGCTTQKTAFSKGVRLFSKGGVYRCFLLPAVLSLRFPFGLRSLCIICHSFFFRFLI